MPGLLETMCVLADLQAEGQIQSLGVTNLDTRAVERLSDADVQLVSNQVKLSCTEQEHLPVGCIRMQDVRIVECSIDVVKAQSFILCLARQVQFSLLDRRALGPNGMLQLCKERGMKLLCYGVLGGGLLSDRHLQPSRSPPYGQMLGAQNSPRF